MDVYVLLLEISDDVILLIFLINIIEFRYRFKFDLTITGFIKCIENDEACR